MSLQLDPKDNVGAGLSAFTVATGGALVAGSPNAFQTGVLSGLMTGVHNSAERATNALSDTSLFKSVFGKGDTMKSIAVYGMDGLFVTGTAKVASSYFGFKESEVAFAIITALFMNVVYNATSEKQADAVARQDVEILDQGQDGVAVPLGSEVISSTTSAPAKHGLGERIVVELREDWHTAGRGAAAVGAFAKKWTGIQWAGQKMDARKLASAQKDAEKLREKAVKAREKADAADPSKAEKLSKKAEKAEKKAEKAEASLAKLQPQYV